MPIKHILENLLIYFTPVLVAFIIAMATNKIPAGWKKAIKWLCLLVFIVVVIYSFLTVPTPDPLEVEWAFYALHENPDSTYDVSTLLGGEEPDLLGLSDSLTTIKGFPVVYSGDQSQMRVKVNRECFVYIFHFDTTLAELRHLFPSSDIEFPNPVSSGSWAEFPVGADAWSFDQQPGLEIFAVFVSLKESGNINARVKKIIEQADKSAHNWAAKIDSARTALRSLGMCSIVKTGEYVHNLASVRPSHIRSYILRSIDGESILLLQAVHHRP